MMKLLRGMNNRTFIVERKINIRFMDLLAKERRIKVPLVLDMHDLRSSWSNLGDILPIMELNFKILQKYYNRALQFTIYMESFNIF